MKAITKHVIIFSKESKEPALCKRHFMHPRGYTNARLLVLKAELGGMLPGFTASSHSSICPDDVKLETGDRKSPQYVTGLPSLRLLRSREAFLTRSFSSCGPSATWKLLRKR